MNFKKIKDSLDRQSYLSLLSDLKAEFASEYLISDGWSTKGHPIVVGIPYKRKSDLQKRNNGKTFHQKENEALSDALDVVKGYLMKHGWTPTKVESVGFIYLSEFTGKVYDALPYLDTDEHHIKAALYACVPPENIYYVKPKFHGSDQWYIKFEPHEGFSEEKLKSELKAWGFIYEVTSIEEGNTPLITAKLSKIKETDFEQGNWEEFEDEDTGEITKQASVRSEKDEKESRYRRKLYDLESAIEDKISWTAQDLQAAKEYASQLQRDQEEELGPLYAEGNEAEAEERAQYYGQEMKDNQEEIETLEEDLEGLQDDLVLVRMELDDPSSVDADQLMDLLTTYEVV